MRRNSIRSIEVNGIQVTNHNGKTQALTEYFKGIIGVLGTSVWHFDNASLYQGHPTPDESLNAPFLEEEALAAIKQMNRCSAAGPDGFGLGFYKAAWQTVRPEIMDFLNAFHQQDVQLDRLNRSHMVLLPKKPSANVVSAFRPISLLRIFLFLVLFKSIF
jgi:hypothetical protein